MASSSIPFHVALSSSSIGMCAFSGGGGVQVTPIKLMDGWKKTNIFSCTPCCHSISSYLLS